MATNSLIKAGCRKLAIISAPASLNIGKDRLRGFEDALKFAGIELNPNMVLTSDFTVQISKNLTYQLLALKDRPDGILVASGLATLGCMDAMREMGFEPGKEIKVAGFLGDLYPGHMEHGLIRVFPPTDELGRQAAKLLLERIKTPEKPIRHVELDVKLMND
jgi:LacI family transcriptional regulator